MIWSFLRKIFVRSIISAAKAHYNQARDIFDTMDFPSVGRRWKLHSLWVRENIDGFKSPMEAVHFARNEINYEANTPSSSLKEIIPKLEKEFQIRYPQLKNDLVRYSESSLLPNTVEHEGRLVSMALYSHVSVYSEILSLMNKVPKRILEIGGGFGSPARFSMLLQEKRPDIYVLIDLPESLFFAETFLCAEFGQNRVHFVEDVDIDIEEIELAGAYFILCPLGLEHRIFSIHFDIVINVGSFGEMGEGWVGFYKKFMDDVKAEYLFSQNYYGQPINSLREGANTYSPDVSTSWKLESVKFFQEDDQYLIRHYAQVLYKHAAEEAFVQNEATIRLEKIVMSTSAAALRHSDIFYVMELYRYVPTGEMAEKILHYFIQHFMPHPKETLYIARSLQNHIGDNYEMYSKLDVSSVIEELEHDMANGITAIAMPKIEGMVKQGKWAADEIH